ncbi:killer toxin resistant protein [Tieghemiomyces parasiticus]|uniref:Killer toxin resistant protein n=1 Tax=Tieghemiomyces parasiticus TaxID=78921 RepID=A0A9W8DUH9_9FUNG|nr:killer toxin resistant protein [Tieghemiomyces parasiticus]
MPPLRRITVGALGLWLLAAVASSALASPPVRTVLKASFPAPPLALELAEYVASENRTAYLPLLAYLTAPAQLALPDEPLYERALAFIRKERMLPHATSTAVMSWGVALHVAAPAVEMFYQYYRETVVPELIAVNPAFDPTCPVWTAYNERQYCQLADLRQALGLPATTTAIDLAADFAQLDLGFSIQAIPRRFPFDHVYPIRAAGSGTVSTGVTFVLYGDATDSTFHPTLIFLHTLVDHVQGVLIIRPRPPVTDHRPDLNLTGYGVSLSIKSTEYKVTDDRPGEAASVDDDADTADLGTAEAADDILIELETATPQVTPLTKDEVAGLAVQAAGYIRNHMDPLLALTRLTHNFPKYAHPLAQRARSPKLHAEVKALLRHRLEPGLWLNGVPLRHNPMRPLNAFSLHEAQRAELRTVRALLALPLDLAQVHAFLTAPTLATPQKVPTQHLWQQEPTIEPTTSALLASRQDPYAAALAAGTQVYDVRDSELAKPVVAWWNDLERDPAYASWPKLELFLRPVYPGQLRAMSKNLCTVLFAVDLSTAAGLETVAEEVIANVDRHIPLRFGVLPLVSPESDTDTPADTMARLFYYVMANYPRSQAAELLITIQRKIRRNPSADVVTLVRAAFQDFATTYPTGDTIPDFDSVAGPRSPYHPYLAVTRDLQNRLGITPAEGAFFVNGRYFDLADGFRNRVMAVYQSDSEILALAYFDGQIDDSTDLYDYFLTRPGVLRTRSPWVFPTAIHPLVVANLLRDLPHPPPPALWTSAIPYFYPLGPRVPTLALRPWISVWVVGDLRTPAVRQDLVAALRCAASDPAVRVAWLPNPAVAAALTTDDIEVVALARTIARAAAVLRDLYEPQAFGNRPGETIPPAVLEHWPTAVECVLAHATAADDTSVVTCLSATFTDNVPAELLTLSHTLTTAAALENWSELARAAGHALELDDTARTLVVNGRVITGFTDATQLTVEELGLLVSYEIGERIGPVITTLDGLQRLGDAQDTATLVEHAKRADMVLLAGAVYYSSTTSTVTDGGPDEPTGRQDPTAPFAGNALTFTHGDWDKAWLRFTVVIDPVSESAQLWSALLHSAAGLPFTAVRVTLRPELTHDELPLTRFYRYVGPVHPVLDPRAAAPAAIFSRLPTEPLYTLAMDTPSAWMVTPVACAYDLDNLQLSTLTTPTAHREGVRSEFVLKHIMVEGHCQDLTTGYPPRGLQLVLGTPAAPAHTGTIVMANYGYFQFLAAPGVWQLGLRPGRSADLFALETVGHAGWTPGAVADVRSEILLNSFQGTTVRPRVRRRPGREADDLLASAGTDDAHGTGDSWLQSAVSWVDDRLPLPAWLPGTQLSARRRRTVHVFSVASGHLYERFLAIMILSVLRHTQNPVKFWFIENFMSPSFKSFLPALAARYGFAYQLVTYQWPYWLRAQREKQRIIWGYKILFLDVLFPLDLDRVIFVDADQIVRTDLADLAALDLQGAPYGYTPFCDNRPEMDRFRFWKDGWWAQHLAGRPYHISALYVVDLRRFRQLAAGDRLRQQYQGLSADPNSLANLDQDLPNHLQHLVPIFSLPQEWLWCETWCSNESLGRAKTIDLCNNPLTKEPKLERAVRLLPEWQTYDSEVARLRAEVAQAAATATAPIPGATHDEL